MGFGNAAGESRAMPRVPTHEPGHLSVCVKFTGETGGDNFSKSANI